MAVPRVTNLFTCFPDEHKAAGLIFIVVWIYGCRNTVFNRSRLALDNDGLSICILGLIFWRSVSSAYFEGEFSNAAVSTKLYDSAGFFVWADDRYQHKIRYSTLFLYFRLSFHILQQNVSRSIVSFQRTMWREKVGNDSGTLGFKSHNTECLIITG